MLNKLLNNILVTCYLEDLKEKGFNFYSLGTEVDGPEDLYNFPEDYGPLNEEELDSLLCIPLSFTKVWVTWWVNNVEDKNKTNLCYNHLYNNWIGGKDYYFKEESKLRDTFDFNQFWIDYNKL